MRLRPQPSKRQTSNAERQTPNALRILILCYEWPPIGGGGGRAAKEIAEALVRRGHEVQVQTARFLGLPPYEVINGVHVHRGPSLRRNKDRSSPFEMASYVCLNIVPAIQRVREFKPDLIHAHFAVPTGALALPVSRLGKVPYLITAHLGDVPGAIPDQTDHLFRWLNPFIRPIWRNAAAIVAVSRFVAGLAKQAYGRDVNVIPNGISLQSRPDVPKSSSKTPRLIFVGRLNRQKNLDFLPDILTEIADLEWELDIVGEGEEGPALRTAFAKLSSRIFFHGWLSPAEVEAKLRNAEIFLLPSHVEGLSVAALEALKFGLVVIGADIPSLRECIEPNANGYLIPTGDRDLWISTLRTLLTDSGRRLTMRQQAWRLVERFDLEKIADEYEELFRATAT
jgi:glycosyltransferase involved in cell wall biosynthesis